ncbi:MAG: fused MFS/spermidine synthase [Bacteroidia bacterium]
MNSERRYYALAMLEGIGVIAVELLSAKILAPYFGTSLIIWTTVIGITLVALAGSYVLGARLSKRQDRDRVLFVLFGIGAVALAFMPEMGPLLFRLFSGLPLLLSVIVCATFLLIPPIMGLGSTTPLLIQGITREVTESGRVSGNVYAISTSGGIMTTFLLGFWVIPDWGVTKPCLLAAGIVLVFSGILLPKIQLSWRLASGGAMTLALVWALLPSGSGSDSVQVVFEQEGVLGQVKVVDLDAVDSLPKSRKLLFNGIPQTYMLKGDYSATSNFNYVHMLAMLSSMKDPGSEVLLCGLGGGSLVMEYKRLGFKTDVVDIDWRLPLLGERYFYLDPKAFDFYVDDARHFIHESPKRYDVITMDIALSESQPYHLYTVEAFEEFKRKLKPDGLLIMNFQGHFLGEEGRAERSIFRTLKEAGFEVHAIPSVGEGLQDVIFVASPTTVPFERLNVRRQNTCCINIAMADIFVQAPRTHIISNPDLNDAVVLRDDRPMLDLIRLPAVLQFRRNKIQSIANKELESQGKLFK